MKLNNEMAITIGTNTELILSASLAIGALELLASSTKFMILARVVSSLTFSAMNLKYPDLFIIAQYTFDPFS